MKYKCKPSGRAAHSSRAVPQAKSRRQQAMARAGATPVTAKKRAQHIVSTKKKKKILVLPLRRTRTVSPSKSAKENDQNTPGMGKKIQTCSVQLSRLESRRSSPRRERSRNASSDARVLRSPGSAGKTPAGVTAGSGSGRTGSSSPARLGVRPLRVGGKDSPRASRAAAASATGSSSSNSAFSLKIEAPKKGASPTVISVGEASLGTSTGRKGVPRARQGDASSGEDDQREESGVAQEARRSKRKSLGGACPDNKGNGQKRTRGSSMPEPAPSPRPRRAVRKQVPAGGDAGDEDADDERGEENGGPRRGVERKAMLGSINVKFKSTAWAKGVATAAPRPLPAPVAPKPSLAAAIQRDPLKQNEFLKCGQCLLWVEGRIFGKHRKACGRSASVDRFSNPVLCADCSQTFPNIKIMMRHKQECPMRSTMETWKSKLAMARMSLGTGRPSQSKIELDVATTAVPLLCVCKKRFKTPQELSFHSKVCSRAQDYSIHCPICNKWFKKDYLNFHMFREHQNIYMADAMAAGADPTSSPASRLAKPITPPSPVKIASNKPGPKTPASDNNLSEVLSGLNIPQNSSIKVVTSQDSDFGDILKQFKAGKLGKSTVVSLSESDDRAVVTNEPERGVESDEKSDVSSKIQKPASTTQSESRPKQTRSVKKAANSEEVNDDKPSSSLLDADTLAERLNELRTQLQTEIEQQRKREKEEAAFKRLTSEIEAESKKLEDEIKRHQQKEKELTEALDKAKTRKKTLEENDDGKEPAKGVQKAKKRGREARRKEDGADDKKVLQAPTPAQTAYVEETAQIPAPEKNTSEKHKIMLIHCKSCGFLSSSVDQHMSHQKECGQADHCVDCLQQFNSKAALQEHRQTGCAGPKKRPRTTPVAQMMFGCTLCRDKFESRTALYDHMKSSHGEEGLANYLNFFCTMCPCYFLSSKALEQHKLSVHNIQQSRNDFPHNDQRLCNTCGKFFAKDRVDEHRRQCGQGTPATRRRIYRCLSCGTTHHSFLELKNHKVQVHGDLGSMTTPIMDVAMAVPLQGRASQDIEALSQAVAARVLGANPRVATAASQDKGTAEGNVATRGKKASQGKVGSAGKGKIAPKDKAVTSRQGVARKPPGPAPRLEGTRVAASPGQRKVMSLNLAEMKAMAKGNAVRLVLPEERGGPDGQRARQAFTLSLNQIDMLSKGRPLQLQLSGSNAGGGDRILAMPQKNLDGTQSVSLIQLSGSDPGAEQLAVKQGWNSRTPAKMMAKSGAGPPRGKPSQGGIPAGRGKAALRKVVPKRNVAGREGVGDYADVVGTVYPDDPGDRVEDPGRRSPRERLAAALGLQPKREDAVTPPKHKPKTLRSGRKLTAGDNRGGRTGGRADPPAAKPIIATPATAAPDAPVDKGESPAGSGAHDETGTEASAASSDNGAGSGVGSLATIQVLRPTDDGHVKCMRCEEVLTSMAQVASHRCPHQQAVSPTSAPDIKQEPHDANCEQISPLEGNP